MPFLYHPFVVHFPLALWMTSFLFDVLYVRRREAFYARASRLLIGLGLLGAAVAIVSGFADFRPLVAQGVGQAFIDQHRTHSFLAYTSTLVYGILFIVRGRGWAMRRGLYVGMAAAAVVLIAVTGYLGGEIRRVM